MPALTCGYHLCTNAATSRCAACNRHFCPAHCNVSDDGGECVLCSHVRIALGREERAYANYSLLAGTVLGALAGLTLGLLTQQSGIWPAGFVGSSALMGLAFALALRL